MRFTHGGDYYQLRWIWLHNKMLLGYGSASTRLPSQSTEALMSKPAVVARLQPFLRSEALAC